VAEILEFRGRPISRGVARGEALVSRDPISFYGGVDPETGVVVERGHALEGRSVAGKILIFPRGKGSTVGTYIIYRLAKRGLAPKAIINLEAEPIVAIGAIISGIPMVDRVSEEILVAIHDGDIVEVDGYRGVVRCLR
jgi:predicted aconitase with swiveling domain